MTKITFPPITGWFFSLDLYHCMLIFISSEVKYFDTMARGGEGGGGEELVYMRGSLCHVMHF
jgi:hypothetical protein